MDNGSRGNGPVFWKRGSRYIMTDGDIKKLVGLGQLASYFSVPIEALEKHPVGEITEESLYSQTKRLENALPNGVYKKSGDYIFSVGIDGNKAISYKEVAEAFGVDRCVVRRLPSGLITEDKVIATMIKLEG